MIKRSLGEGCSSHTFSCGPCHRRKVKCDRGNPCSYCISRNIDCIPSHLATTNRPRKQRFPEAELLARIKKYEAALRSYGADLESIQQSSESNPLSSSKRVTSGSPLSDNYTATTSSDHHHDEEEEQRPVFSILDGNDIQTTTDKTAGQQWYDRIFSQESDPCSFLFAVDPIEVAPHPAPFDLFKLWQIYCDNVHPLNKILHAPTFQRKITDYGSHLYLAPPSDQALFFAVYIAALTTLSSDECEAIFFTKRDTLLDQYKLSTQVWLRRAGIWRTSELSVLQAFVLYLSSIQNVVDPRSISCFTVVADRIARRMGLHKEGSQQISNPLQQEIGRRVWWELLFLEARIVEKVGLGSNAMIGNWAVQLPSNRSDIDLESMKQSTCPLSTQPSSEVLLFLLRAEAAQFLANLRCQKDMQRNRMNNSSLKMKLQMVDTFEKHIQSRLLQYCDFALPHHRLTTFFAQLILSRMRMSIYIIEESICKQESKKKEIGLELLHHCTCNLKAFTDMRGDTSLECFKWFILQNLPILGYIHLLRLLQVYTEGINVDEAWQVVEKFINTGIRLVVDSLTMKAWNARIAASSSDYIQEPSFISKIKLRMLDTPSSVDILPHLTSSATTTIQSDKGNSPSDSDFMSMLNEMMTGEAYNEFDWSLLDWQ